jgi:hypothetical protein
MFLWSLQVALGGAWRSSARGPRLDPAATSRYNWDERPFFYLITLIQSNMLPIERRHTPMRLPRIDFQTGRLGCPICHQNLPLPLSLDARDRTCSCGVVAGLLSKIAVHAQWGVGKDVRPREGYHVILPYRNTTGLEDYVIFEQPDALMSVRHSQPHDVKDYQHAEGRRVRNKLASRRRTWWRRSIGV